MYHTLKLKCCVCLRLCVCVCVCVWSGGVTSTALLIMQWSPKEAAMAQLVQ